MKLNEIFNWEPVGFGVPGAHQWPLFVLSKLTLVLAPMYVVWLYRRALPTRWRNTTAVTVEKLLAHAAFYVGMGLPIIGLDSVLDFPRLVGFTITNFFFHETLPVLLKERWLKRLFPEWIPTLGVNLLMGEELLELSAYVNARGKLKVIESPYSESKDFLRSVYVEERGGESHATVELKSLYVPDNVRPILKFSAPAKPGRLSRRQVGKLIQVDLGELEPFAMPVYLNKFGQKSLLWRDLYWTKFFNEMGGRSYITYAFAVIRKGITVLVATPLAFATGNLFVHLSQGGAWTWDVYRFFSYGIILAFTLGGMYGASICSTLVELGTWLYYRRIKRLKLSSEGGAIRKKSRFRSLKWGPDKFGAFLEGRSRVYRSLRFLLGGILAGGLGAWFLTYQMGGRWQERAAAFEERRFLQPASTVARDGQAVPRELPRFSFPSSEEGDLSHRLDSSP
jgi:hypothetical protein